MLPNLVVIGAQKAGTTSLHRYLQEHPEIAMSTPKELNFFTSPRWNWPKGVGWYESYFEEPATVRGESSPSYTTYPRETGIPERMHEVIPEARLIYLVRDPVDRMLSQYLHDRASGSERRPVEEALGDLDPDWSPYVVQGRYHLQLSQFLEHYPRERVLVVAQEELMRSRAATLRRIFEFLGVDPGFSSRRFAVMANTSADKQGRAGLRGRARQLTRLAPASVATRVEAALSRPRGMRLDPAIRRTLERYFADDAERLRNVTGLRLESWSV
jgi:hypothetical protein